MAVLEWNMAAGSGAQGPALRIAASLRRQIRTGELAVGDRMPPERVLAREMGVSPATVQKVLKELEREGLVKGEWGRGRFVTDWRTSKTWAIAVLLYEAAHLQHPVMMRRLGGIQPPLQEAGYHVHFIVMNRHARGGEQDWPTLIPPSRFDGAIVLAVQAQAQQVHGLAEHMPVVWMDHRCTGPHLAGVWADMIGGGLLAAEHLVELGHRRIALLSAGHSTVVQDQLEGLQLAVRRTSGLSASWLSVSHSWDHESIRQRVRDAFGGADRPTGLICGSDDVVSPALEQLQAMGLRVPTDVSVVGWNDTLAPPAVPVPMTSVRIDVAAAGRAATEALGRMLEGDPPGLHWLSQQVKPAELVVRASTATPGGPPGGAPGGD